MKTQMACGLVLVLFVVGCGGDKEETTGVTGAASEGGAAGAGGADETTVGRTATGGKTGVGGLSNTGGRVNAVGGSSSTTEAGQTSLGGADNAGGTANLGGSALTAGAPASGGALPSSGGALSSTAGNTSTAGTAGTTTTDGTCATIYYRDADNDTWGSTITSCTGGAGWVTRTGDCSDTNSNVHPDQTETFDVAYTTTSGASSFDYNCDNTETSARGAQISTGQCVTSGLGNSCIGDGYLPVELERIGTNLNQLCGSTRYLVCSRSQQTCIGAISESGTYAAVSCR